MADNPNDGGFERSSGLEAPSTDAGMSVGDATESAYNDWDTKENGISEAERSAWGPELQKLAVHEGTSVRHGINSLVSAHINKRYGTPEAKQLALAAEIDAYQINPMPQPAAPDEFAAPVNEQQQEGMSEDQASHAVHDFVRANPVADDPQIQSSMLQVARRHAATGFCSAPSDDVGARPWGGPSLQRNGPASARRRSRCKSQSGGGASQRRGDRVAQSGERRSQRYHFFADTRLTRRRHAGTSHIARLPERRSCYEGNQSNARIPERRRRARSRHYDWVAQDASMAADRCTAEPELGNGAFKARAKLGPCPSPEKSRRIEAGAEAGDDGEARRMGEVPQRRREPARYRRGRSVDFGRRELSPILGLDQNAPGLRGRIRRGGGAPSRNADHRGASSRTPWRPSPRDRHQRCSKMF